MATEGKMGGQGQGCVSWAKRGAVRVVQLKEKRIGYGRVMDCDGFLRSQRAETSERGTRMQSRQAATNHQQQQQPEKQLTALFVCDPCRSSSSNMNTNFVHTTTATTSAAGEFYIQRSLSVRCSFSPQPPSSAHAALLVLLFFSFCTIPIRSVCIRVLDTVFSSARLTRQQTEKRRGAHSKQSSSAPSCYLLTSSFLIPSTTHYSSRS